MNIVSPIQIQGLRGRDHLILIFTPTSAINADHD